MDRFTALVVIGRDWRQTALILVTTVSVFSSDLSRQPNYTSSCISCIAHASCVHCHTCRHTGVPGHVYFLPAGSVRMCPMPILHLSRFVILPIIYIAKAVRLGPSKNASGLMISLGRIICAELWQTKLETRTLFVMREKNVNVHDHKILWTLSLVTWRKCQINENKIHRNLCFQHNRTHVAVTTDV